MHLSLNSKEKRHAPRIQRLPHKRHSQAQPIASKTSRPHTRTNALHLTQEQARRRTGLRIQFPQHRIFRKHVRKGAIRELEMRTSEGSEDDNVK